MDDVERCDAFQCDAPATRSVRWGSAPASAGRYCDACALISWRAGDDVQPPFELAPVVPLHRA